MFRVKGKHEHHVFDGVVNVFFVSIFAPVAVYGNLFLVAFASIVHVDGEKFLCLSHLDSEF